MRTIRYRRGPHHITVKVDTPKPTVCQACGGTFKGRRLNCHHWRYEWSFDEVREKPERVLDNSANFCFIHHRVADALRYITEELQKGRLNPEQLWNVIDTMPTGFSLTSL